MPVQSGPHLVPCYSCQLFIQGQTQENPFLGYVHLSEVLLLFQGHGSFVTFQEALHVLSLTCAHIMAGCIPVMTLLQSHDWHSLYSVCILTKKWSAPACAQDTSPCRSLARVSLLSCRHPLAVSPLDVHTAPTPRLMQQEGGLPAAQPLCPSFQTRTQARTSWTCIQPHNAAGEATLFWCPCPPSDPSYFIHIQT